MSDEYRKEEKVEKKPGLVGATFIKYAFITVILLIVLFFIANYLLPMIPGGEGSGTMMYNALDTSISSDADKPISG
ncbi:hypothetical protein [Salipaludibacillus sp. CF4.18]|uniref:hypothetical protein n=1 Tax=Salipaludibacillus sp. CF4.18 TaxID=3373081 RepID=UPI003EE55F58